MKFNFARFLVLTAIAFAAFSFCLNSIVSAQTIKTRRVNSLFNSGTAASNFDDDARQILELVNAERRRKRLTELEWDNDLARMAQSYSRRMARENFFDHIDFDGKDVADRAKSAKIKGWSKIGENLFYCEGVNQLDSFAVRGWMKSPTHRQNILDQNWTTTGIGIAEANGEVYITQIFIER